MEANNFRFRVLHIGNMPAFVILLLIKNGELYPFSFIFHKRATKDDFILTGYPDDAFPSDDAIEIEVCDIPSKLLGKDEDAMHIATNKERSPNERYVCAFPEVGHDKAVEVAKMWARYNVRLLETGETSVDPEGIAAYELDTEIEVYSAK
jgi:hypothetical protein